MSVIEGAKEEGSKEGREEAHEKILTIARNMKASEMSAEEIEKMTGLPKD